jgi:riboflavin kinase/FMN adenylyltransferase
MQLLNDRRPAPHGACVVSIGMFDGVHRGHRQVLAQLRAQGERLGLPTVVLTFDPHPRSVLRPHEAPRLISRLERRLELLADTGDVDHCLVLPFDVQRSRESVEQFVGDTLIARLGMRALVVGENFACGQGRRGDISYLTTLGAAAGFEVFPVTMLPAPHDERAVSCSSSVTRCLIQSGELDAAAALLDRPHELPCTVMATTAAPQPLTEALLPDDLCVPPAGAYAGEVRLPDRDMPWIRSLIQVDAPAPQRAGSVRIAHALRAKPGDAICLRFVGPRAAAESARGA